MIASEVKLPVIYRGACHCGLVRFEVESSDPIECCECNCSICRKTGFLHLIVPLAKFRILQGDENLTLYTFNTGVAKHYFCKTCGIKPFYVPRSNPDGMDINVRCLEPMPTHLTITQFDGQNWEQHAADLAHLSRT